MAYLKLEKNTRQVDIEEQMLAFWDEEKIFVRSLELAKKNPRFNFFEGPPTANGKPGVHHVISRAVKDIVCRYKTMTGHFVERKAGWDTHGLPVEIQVEKQLGLESKRMVEGYGIDKFNEACRNSVFTYLKDWEWMTRRIGYWLDMEHPYITYTPNYVESVWWILAQFFKAGLIYKGHKVLPYCARCGTGLSDHEVALGYRDTEDPSVYVRMKVLSPLFDENFVRDDVKFLVWTTTPWTLLSNVALAVHEDYEYALIEFEDEKLIVVKNRLEAIFGAGKFNVIKSFTGKQLIGVQYEPPYKFVETQENGWYVLTADYVTTEDGTGIVHTAPAFGKEDYDTGKKWNLPFVQLVDDEGKIKDVVKPFAGLWFKDADKQILKDLNERGILFRREKITHSYPFCWRCDSPLVQFARSSWYIRTTAFKQRMLEENEKIRWYPPQIGSGRFGEWLKNNIDWALSRERFWGTPLNIWICEDCGNMIAPQSFAELRSLATAPIAEDLDPHKPYVDRIELKCSCGKNMKRTPEVIDCWFDSGAMPFAQSHYPFENEGTNFQTRFPADFISEGVDQTRGWFYTLLAISTFVKDMSPYKTCISIELVLDKNGKKMSKTKGNVVDAVKIVNENGADPLRWYFITTSPPWLPTRFDVDGIVETSRKFFDTLSNTYSFFVLYANIDEYEPNALQCPKCSNILDRWMLSRLNTLKKQYRAAMENYQMTKAARMLQSFVVDELSNWYVRRSRRRFWGSGMDTDKRAAYDTLWYVLVETCELIAPFTPMTAEFFWRALTEPIRDRAGDSVHFRLIPFCEEEVVDASLEAEMEQTIRIVELGRSARNTSNINIRQPLSRAVAIIADDIRISEQMLSVIREELNIKSFEFASDARNFMTYKARANFKTLGKRMGAKMPATKAAIESLTSDEIAESLATTRVWQIAIDGEIFALDDTEIEIIVESKAPFAVAVEKGFVVALDTTITHELLLEGFAREIINRVQNTRKDAGLEVTDRINLNITTDDINIIDALKTHAEHICRETLTETIIFDTTPDARYFSKDWQIEDKNVRISVINIA